MKDLGIFYNGSQTQLTHSLKENHPTWMCQTTLGLKACRCKNKHLLLQVTQAWKDRCRAYCSNWLVNSFSCICLLLENRDHSDNLHNSSACRGDWCTVTAQLCSPHNKISNQIEARWRKVWQSHVLGNKWINARDENEMRAGSQHHFNPKQLWD